MDFGPRNVAEFEFLGDGKFSGTMFCAYAGEFGLMGKLDAGASRNGTLDGCVSRWKNEYWSINEASYENARVARWGRRAKWVHFDQERESNSDTDGDERSAQRIRSTGYL